MVVKNKEIFEGYCTTGVCIMSPTYFCVSLEQDDEQVRLNDGVVRSRFFTYDIKEGEDTLQYEGVKGGWVYPKVVHSKTDDFLAADGVGNVFYCELEDWEPEKPITNNRCGISGLKNINGKIFGVAPGRAVYERTGVGQWKEHEELGNIPGTLASGLNSGFRSIDGFSDSDIYAVGGNRDVWHFNGKEWNPIDIGGRPFRCQCVVCAEDGYVYIGGKDGVIARGRGDIWKVRFPEEKGAEHFYSIASYRGRVFIGTEEDTFIVGEDLTLQRYDFEGQIRPIAGRFMYAAYDRLLMANVFNQVAFFDGEKWLDINGCSELTPVEEAYLLEQKMHLLEEAEELMALAENEAKK